MLNSDMKHINPSPEQKLLEVEELAHVLKRLLVQHEGALDEEGIRREVETLEQWIGSYQQGLKAANKISSTGVECLLNLRDRLRMSAAEKQRLENEGGGVASQEQVKRTEELLDAARRIDNAIPGIEQIFSLEEHA